MSLVTAATDQPRPRPTGHARLAAGLHGLALVILLAGLVWLARSFGDLPDRVAVHFGFSGEPDRWGPRGVLLIVPGLGLVVWTLLALVGRIPHRFNYPWPITPANAQRQYRLAECMLGAVNVLCSAALALVTIGSIEVGLGRAARLDPLPMLLWGALLFTTVISYLAAGSRIR